MQRKQNWLNCCFGFLKIRKSLGRAFINLSRTTLRLEVSTSFVRQLLFRSYGDVPSGGDTRRQQFHLLYFFSFIYSLLGLNSLLFIHCFFIFLRLNPSFSLYSFSISWPTLLCSQGLKPFVTAAIKMVSYPLDEEDLCLTNTVYTTYRDLLSHWDKGSYHVNQNWDL